MAAPTEAIFMNDTQWFGKMVPLPGARAEEFVAPAPPPAPLQVVQHAEHAPVMPQAAAPMQPQPIYPTEVQPAPSYGKMESAKIAGVAAAHHVPHIVPQATARRSRKIIHETMPDLGLLNQFMDDQAVGDILVNGVQSIYVDRNGLMVDSGIRFATHEEVWQVAEAIVQSVGQTISPDKPMVDTRLPDGTRVNIVAPPMAVDGVSMSIRKFPTRQITLETMVQSGQLSPELGQFLSECVAQRLNIIVCGGTGSGKTTLLNALSGAIGDGERVVTIEDSAELRLQKKHVVRLEAKAAIAGGKPEDEVTIRELVKNALRMRPDRIVVGESRGAEALDMLQAMNTGHNGSMTTLHANTPRDALSRLETMVTIGMPQLPLRLVRQQIASTVNLIINMARCKDGVRRVMYVSEITGIEGEIIVMQDLVVYADATGSTPGEFRWATGSPRNPLVTDAARNSGIMRIKR
jgi:pilus assembly protein CpaF